MNGSALARLFTGTARGGRGRLLGMIAGVMIGVALVLLLWGGASNLGERSIRGSAADWPSGDRYLYDPALLGDDEAAVRATLDYFDGTPIPVLHIAVTESTTMTAPGLERIPGPGEYVASPAMVALIDENPGELLGDRYGARTGEISRDGLSSPDQLQLFVGHSAAELLELSGGSALLLTEFEGTDFDSAAYRALTIVGVIAVLTPVLLLIGIVTNLGSAQRAERIATLRLIGASPRQVARLTAAETAIATAVGSLLGVGVYFLLIPLAAQMPINDGRFYYRDLVASPWEIAAVVVAAVGLSVLVAYRRAVRSDLGPLGGSRERHERPPRATSFIPLAIGVALMGVGVWLASEGYATSMPLMIGAFVLIIGGILWSGPHLTATVATAVARHASGPTAVIAMGRIVRHPRAAFRAVSGLIVAVFTATVFAVAVTSSEEIPPVPNEPGSIRADVLAAHVSVDQDHELLDRVRGEIEALSGVTAAVIASQNHDAEMVFAAVGTFRAAVRATSGDATRFE